MADDPPRHPTALISWSHVDPEWSTTEVAARRDAVLVLANALRRRGVDADVDLFHLSSSVDWTRWGPRRVDECDFVLVVVSGGWRRAWEGRGDPRKGAGAAAEANALRSLYARDRDAFQHKVRLVLLPGAPASDIPTGLHGVARFRLSSIDDAGLQELFRNLTNQPEFVAVELGDLPELPPASRSAHAPPPPTDQVQGRSEGSAGPALAVTPELRNALSKARDYLRVLPLSEKGLVGQLAAEGFSTTDAGFAAANVGASWAEQAVKKAEAYLVTMAFSETGLVAQLVADGFERAESEVVVAGLRVDWVQQAEKKAGQYLAYTSFSRSALVRQLVHDGFAEEEAQSAVASVYR